MTLPSLAGAVWRDFRRTWTSLIVFEAVIKLIEAWLLIPAVAFVLSAVLSRSGHVAVSNRDLLNFILSPSGLLYAALFCTVAVTLLLVEQAGLMSLVAWTDSAEGLRAQMLVLPAFLKTLRVLRLGAVKVAQLALTFIPFILLAALTYGLLLSRHDINHYLNDQPPVFWLASGIGVILLITVVATGLWLYVRWAFALPILLFEKDLTVSVLRASRERIRGIGWRVGLILLGWQLLALLIGVGMQAGFRLISATVLQYAGERPKALILVLLVAQGGLLAFHSFVTVIGQALVTRRLYLLRNEELGVLPLGNSVDGPSPDPTVSPKARRLGYLSMVAAFACLTLILIAPLSLWADLPRHLATRAPIKVTAHRGHSRAAPENTLSAVRKAIESRADYAEVDVQLTADGVVVLLHDRDLKRVAGDSRRIEDISYTEVQKLDVGRFFDPSFTGERVPTLEDVIKLCQGRIRMNIELKFYGSDRRLPLAVERVVREQAFEANCLVTSFSLDVLLDLKRSNPRLQTGLTVAQALGDVSRLEVDALSVRADWLSDELLRSAHHVDKEVHVWTVNEARQMTQLIKRGVDNIITDDPDLMIRVRDEWAALSGAERLLLASRVLLGLDP